MAAKINWSGLRRFVRVLLTAEHSANEGGDCRSGRASNRLGGPVPAAANRANRALADDLGFPAMADGDKLHFAVVSDGFGSIC
ncbi:hypothetical protein [Bradyrhizobium australiense]|uniref:Uncharacterized protein n=1 Tax=Bradyrhizobium australiense TaxID=2721161 RepID=A0A7Y4GPE9_9BRAD|nr:hypothetical protein [Bradyrhizobium australiense]NOJ39441.1 hypothetical protein [Bradyrhizobium australiense]